MNEQDWRTLAAQNPGRVTYPSWRPPEYWAARSKKDPWRPIEDNRNFWSRVKPRQAWNRIIQKGWPGKPIPAVSPSGMKMEKRPAAWDRTPDYYRRNL